ncbi:hypothetical protein RJ639_015113, partial [Escallonia herrerae]
SNMEACRRLCLLTLVSSLLLVFIVTSAANPSSTSSSLRASGGSSRGGEKVTLALYYETLCPYCSNCIVNYLPKIFDGGLIDIVDLKLVPYGNAKIGNNNSITCQMACPRLGTLCLISYLLCFSSLSLMVSSFTPPAAAAAALLTDSSEKVSLGLYYESLCPYSANFIVNYLVKIFYNGLIDYVDLNLVPWGNAKLIDNTTFQCQHGPAECLLNTIEACAIGVWPDVNEHFPFIYCVETLVYEQKYPEWETCFEKLNLDPTPVTECYSSGYGNELELKYAAETNALQPRHTYVPWVVVNGEPLYDDYENFVSYVCKAYKGTKVPEACSDLSHSSVRKERSNSIHPVCYSEETTKSTLSRIRSAVASWVHQVNTIASM